MKRALTVALGGAAIVVGGLVGCSSDKSAKENVSSATESAKTAASEATECRRRRQPTPSRAIATGRWRQSQH